jgi:hypothetical protein
LVVAVVVDVSLAALGRIRLQLPVLLVLMLLHDVVVVVLIMSGVAVLPVDAWQEWRTSTPTPWLLMLSSGPMSSQQHQTTTMEGKIWKW